MDTAQHRIAFGPVPSRRLGQSLGINNVPTKTCSYSCVYCQVGSTTDQEATPRDFFAPQQIQDAVAAHLARVSARDARVDYLTLVPDGEPTLDAQLGAVIDALHRLDLPVAVITNASLLWRADVRRRLQGADLVSVKVDTVADQVWRRLNRPHPDLELARVLDGIRAFAAEYSGTLLSDTMLIGGFNDGTESLADCADFLAGIEPDIAYLALPTRPTTIPGLQRVGESGLLRAYQIFSARLSRVELLAEHETGRFADSGDARNDLLAVTAVHPMRAQDLSELLARNRADWSLVETLLAEGELKAVQHDGTTFYLRPTARERPAD